jgi:hypothetical protein
MFRMLKGRSAKSEGSGSFDRSAERWVPVGSEASPHRLLKLCMEGAVEVLGHRLTQDTLKRLSPIRVGHEGNGAIRWRTGTGIQFEALAPDATHAFRYDHDRSLWFAYSSAADASLAAILEPAWTMLGGCTLVPFTFHDDGTIEVDGRRFGQDVKFTECRTGNGILFEKKGFGEEFVLYAPDATVALIYRDGCWFGQRRAPERR